jgi:hypothetical protein
LLPLNEHDEHGFELLKVIFHGHRHALPFDVVRLGLRVFLALLSLLRSVFQSRSEIFPSSAFAGG